MSLASLVRTLPSTHRFLRSIERALRDGCSVWVLLPQGIEHLRLEDLLLQYLEGTGGMSVGLVDLSNAGDCEPFEVLRGIVGDWEDVGEVRILEDLTSYHQAPEVLLVKSLEEIPVSKRADWFMAVDRWTVASRSHPPGQRRKLCIVISADSLPQIPQSDITISVQMWWGIPSSLETRLACRLASREENHTSLWREHLIPSLAGSDLVLGEFLWDTVTERGDKILESLAMYGAERGWSRKDAEEVCRHWKPIPPGESQDFPSRQIYPFWARGWVVYTVEYGGEIHSALLALLEDESEIAHRLWRAQVALLLPIVDSARVNICKQLTQRYGGTWSSWADEWDDALYPELGVIESALRKGPVPESDKQRWLRVVHLVRETRNRLAHYNPISFQEFAEFWERVAPFLRRG